MTNPALNTRKSVSESYDIEPMLAKVMQDAAREHQKLQDVFQVMGWGGLPDTLKMEIKDDVEAMVRELEGCYSTCDPYVLKRRERVSYWVDAFRDGICSLQTAIDALKVKKL